MPAPPPLPTGTELSYLVVCNNSIIISHLLLIHFILGIILVALILSFFLNFGIFLYG